MTQFGELEKQQYRDNARARAIEEERERFPIRYMTPEVPLVDRWEALGEAHTLVETEEHDAWPRTTCWVRYVTRCSCGEGYPVVSVTTAEQRSDAHISSFVRTHRQLHHLKHLVSLLLDEDPSCDSS